MTNLVALLIKVTEIDHVDGEQGYNTALIHTLRLLTERDTDLDSVGLTFKNVADAVMRRVALRYMPDEAQEHGVAFLRNYVRFGHLCVNLDVDTVNHTIDLSNLYTSVK